MAINNNSLNLKTYLNMNILNGLLFEDSHFRFNQILILYKS